MQHISEVLNPIVERLNPHRRTPTYEANGGRIMSRASAPCWLSIDEAEREAFKLTALLVKSDDPGEVLPLVSQLAWAIRDAREAGNDPLPPAAMARAA